MLRFNYVQIALQVSSTMVTFNREYGSEREPRSEFGPGLADAFRHPFINRYVLFFFVTMVLCINLRRTNP